VWMACACILQAAAYDGGEEESLTGLDERGPTSACALPVLPPWSEEFAAEPGFDAKTRCAVAALSAVAPKACRGRKPLPTGAPAVTRHGVLALRQGVPDRWKAFAWLHASGATSLARDLGAGGIDELRPWYERQVAGTFGEDLAPKAFAEGPAGRAPLFDGRATLPGGIDGLDEFMKPSATLESAWPALVGTLTSAGVSAAKRILWVLNWLWHGQARLCPWVAPLVLMLLLFCEEHEVCAALHCTMQRAVQVPERAAGDQPRARAFLFTDDRDLHSGTHQFLSLAKACGGAPARALARLTALGVDLPALVAGLLQDCLASRLPPRVFLRLVGPLLCEGWKAPARVLLALLSNAAPFITQCPDAAAALRMLGCKTFATPTRGGAALDTLMREAFEARLQSRKHPFGAACTLALLVDSGAHELLTWPRLAAGTCSSLLDNAALVTLWSGPLPELARLRRPRLVFSCAHDGYSVRALAQCCEAATASAGGDDVPMLFVVATVAGALIGGYAPLLWRKTGGSYMRRGARFEEAFVFAARRSAPSADGAEGPACTLAPLAWHGWTGANELLLSLGDDGLLFGGDLPAIGLDAELATFSSWSCGTFGSLPLQAPPAPPWAEGSSPGTSARRRRCLAAAAQSPAADAPLDFQVAAMEVFAFLADEGTATHTW